mgnify:CR=1 FL=1
MLRRYAVWAGNEQGDREAPNHCVEALWNGMWDLGRQCQRNRGYGEDGLYCKQHAKNHPAKPTEQIKEK